MKKILFVINTMGCAGAEIALLRLLNHLDETEYDISLYVLTGQGELFRQVPSYVRIRNTTFSYKSVLTKDGRYRLVKTIAKAFVRNGNYLRKMRNIFGSFLDMLKAGRIQKDKLFWRVLAEGGQRFEETFDVAIAWLEGGSSYYVADYIKAEKKAAFIHIDYEKAGYTRGMDQNCWKRFDRIFTVSEKVKEKFVNAYPEYREKTTILRNMIDLEYIRRRAREPGGFLDDYKGVRILTVGRLTYQKGYDIAIEAMKLLLDSGCCVRWYVLGDGDQRKSLERKIKSLGLENDFLLLGFKENPYPYYVQTDLYVHATRFEGQSIAIQEAQILGCTVIASDCCGADEQIEKGKYGESCVLTPEGIAESIKNLLIDEKRRATLGKMALSRQVPKEQGEIFMKFLN